VAFVGKHKTSGWRIIYVLYAPTRIIEQEKYRRTKEKALAFLKEAEKFESFTRQRTYTDEDVRKAVNFKVLTEDEAQEFLKIPVVNYPSLKELLPFYKEYAGKHWNQKTYDSYMATTNMLLNDIGNVAISNTSEFKKMIEDYVKDAGAKKKLSNRTKNTYLDRIRQIIDVAIKANKFPFIENPVTLIDKYPDEAVRIPRVLTYDEAAHLLSESKQRTALFGLFYEATLVYLFCGLRLEELKYLTHKDVLDDRIMIQPKRIAPHETEQELKGGKWNPKRGSTRAIYIEDDIWQGRVIEKIKNIPVKGRFVFSQNAKSINKYAIDSAYNDRFFKKSDLSLHCLRHTFITWRIECGDPLPRVMYLAGHRDIETTMRYTHISEKKIKNIIDLI